MTLPSPDNGQLLRFSSVTRLVHWSTALLFVILIVSGAALYVPALVDMVGHRILVERIHVYAGFALCLPLLASLAGPWGRALRVDLRRLNRWSRSDRLWLRQALLRRRSYSKPLRLGKFNAGQKLNAAFAGGVMVVMLMTGAIMHWPQIWPIDWRTGATFIHDLVASLFVVVVVGHVGMALAHPALLKSMVTGKVSRAWAERHAEIWLEEAQNVESIKH